ncbi:MAG TPA: ester cyclase [Thermomicrobiales bacterium]|nr:ester cyclase [Thermomicrobiales bacterium]
MSTEENKAITRRWYDTHVPGRVEEGAAMLTDDFRGHMPGVPQPLDVAGFRQMGEMFFAAFADIEQTVEDQVAEGDLVASRGSWWGTHTGAFQGIPPTGKRIAMTWIGLDRLAGGKIAEHFAQLDLLGVLQQLGAIPAPAQAPA